jgi:hypothetical protein
MKLSHALTALLLLTGSSAYAGSTYTYFGSVVDNNIQAGVTVPPDGDIKYTPVPAPSTAEIQLGYYPGGIPYSISVGDVSVVTSGFTTTYTNDVPGDMGSISISAVGYNPSGRTFLARAFGSRSPYSRS